MYLNEQTGARGLSAPMGINAHAAPSREDLRFTRRKPVPMRHVGIAEGRCTARRKLSTQIRAATRFPGSMHFQGGTVSEEVDG
jgi:hypothetical protein